MMPLLERKLEWYKENTRRCPVENTYAIISKKFVILILRDMMIYGHTRFNQLLNSVEDINPNTLSIRLKEMEEEGLVERKVYPQIPILIEYRLTEKGQALKGVINEMTSFSMQYYSRQVFKEGKPRGLHKVLGQPIQLID